MATTPKRKPKKGMDDKDWHRLFTILAMFIIAGFQYTAIFLRCDTSQLVITSGAIAALAGFDLFKWIKKGV